MEAKRVATPPPAPTTIAPPASTILSISHISWIKPGVPNNFNGDQSKGQAFLMSCELYMLLTASDFPNDHTHIH
jgi:hypothetical protein